MATEAWFLTAADGYVGDRSNESTARGFTRKGLSIKESFFPSSPPQPSKLWVHSPEAAHVDTPRVLCIAGDLILFRVAVSSDGVPDSRFSTRQDCDYFIYRHSSPGALTLLTDMRTRCFEDTELGILPHGGGLHHYTIAALVPLSFDEYELHLFRSETSSWTSMVLPVVEPQLDFHTTNTDLCCHDTTNVITIGGEYGTMGWVDLLRGILLCDVLREKPTLRGIPFPLPMEHITADRDYLGRATDCRGIAFVNGSLKFVPLDFIASHNLHVLDPETDYPTLRVDDWAISSWINPTMENSYQAWGEPECTVQAAEVTIKTDMISHPTGMLLACCCHQMRVLMTQKETSGTLWSLTLSELGW